ncbi:MAG: hypothetical protein GY778_10920 [bacterium]|nr:hypothetical protein [bacterium]
MANVYRVVRAHELGHADPLVLKKGDRVPFERRQTEWDGWLWCSTPTGESGWIPEPWVKIQGDVCVVQRDYNALELAVQPGATLEAILTESGWLLAISSTGTTGWVPLECVELLTSDAT